MCLDSGTEKRSLFAVDKRTLIRVIGWFFSNAKSLKIDS
ncbi:hypothetical protein LCGC14_2933420, partial [marine sediment metagenome]